MRENNKTRQAGAQTRSGAPYGGETRSGASRERAARPAGKRAAPVSGRKTPKAYGHRTRRRRLRARRIFAIFLLIFTVGVFATLSLTVFFKITDVTVSGNIHYSEEAIEEKAGIALGENLFLAPISKAKASILNDLPYVSSVRVKRRLPAVIAVQIEETSPAFCVIWGTSYYLCDKYTKVLENIGESPGAGMPVIGGITQEEPKVGEFIAPKEGNLSNRVAELLGLIEEHTLSHLISKIDFDGEFFVGFMYKEQISVNLGSTVALPEKIGYFAELAAQLPEGQKGDMDLSNPVRVSFRPAGY